MPTDLGTSMNRLDSRVSQLEQRTLSSTRPTTNVYLDGTGATVVEDPLDWSVSSGGWESYSQIGPIITDTAHPDYPGGVLSTSYGRAETRLLGGLCVLSGMVRRKTGASTLAAGTRYDIPMFALPVDWRPRSNVILPCLMGNANPDPSAPSPASVFGTAWIEIRPEVSPVLRSSGRAYFVTGTLSCPASTGWIALQGLFPCQLLSST
jgi:hypothetical protein